MEKDTDLCTLVILDSSRCLVAQRLDQKSTLTLVATVSEDPATWDEAASVWPRYRTDVVCNCASELPLESMASELAMECLAISDSWIVVDFRTKRIFHGGDFELIGRDGAFAMVIDKNGGKKSPVYIHLPPWWELHENVSLLAVTEPRQNPILRPVVDREVLYGSAFLRDISNRSLDAIARSNEDDSQLDDFDWIVRLHREWLMTPREDLCGRIPRELLHGAIHWIDRITEGQEKRYQEQDTLIALPKDWPGYATAPMGSQEMCMYFDFCRAMIGAAWDWCLVHEDSIANEEHEVVLSRMLEALQQTKKAWMTEPLEDGPTPEFIIECDRRRVPVGDGVVIEGMDEVAKQNHEVDCKCPICAVMAEGIFGTSFGRITGYHLEMDQEFAFSMTESWEEWESEHQDYDEFQESTQSRGSDVRPTCIDENLSSAWMGIGSHRPSHGDRRGHLKMAFMVAEMVSVLESYPNRGIEIQSLNIAFTEYRKAQGRRINKAARKLNRVLETLASRYTELVSKSADLQSYIDESVRVPVSGDDGRGMSAP